MNNSTGRSSTSGNNGSFMKWILAAVTVLVITLILIVAEAVMSRTYTITNNSSENIESIIVYMEGEDEVDSYRSANLFEHSVKAGEKVGGSFEKLGDDYLPGSSLMIEVKFEGHDRVLLYSGYFVSRFDGKIKLVFEDDAKEEGNIKMAIKAGSGIFQSTEKTDCDEIIDVFSED